MEEFFLRCIDDVKRDVARRRTKANTRAQKTRAGANPLLRAGATGSPVGATHASFDKDFATDTVAARAEVCVCHVVCVHMHAICLCARLASLTPW